MRLAFIILLLSALPVGAQELSSSDRYVYATDDEGETLTPLRPTSVEAGTLVSMFEKYPPPSFAKAEHLYSYLPVGDAQYLVTTSGSHPQTNGIFLVDLHADSLRQLISGDYEVRESRVLPREGKWFLVESSGGLHGAGGTALTAIVVMRTASGKVNVDAKDLVAVSWDMEQGLCGTRLKDGKAGEIGPYSVADDGKRPVISVEVTEQDCRTQKIQRKHLRFSLRGRSFEPAP